VIGRLGAAALLTVVLVGCGGTEVRGYVREEGTGEPLRGATVSVGGESTQTDASGFYELEADIEQPARLEVQAPGYEQKNLIVSDEGLDTIISDVELAKESQERQQTRQEFDDAERMLEEAERNVEDAERKVFEARRDFEQGGATTEQRIEQPGGSLEPR
jgi:hypothetical protein